MTSPTSSSARPISAVSAEGDSLALAPRTVDLGAAAPERDLTRAEIDGAIAPAADAIIACINDATGSAPVTGRVVAGVVVDETGHVTKTRLEGPSYLLKHGLGGCVRPKLRGLRFPATGKPTVVRVPFDVS